MNHNFTCSLCGHRREGLPECVTLSNEKLRCSSDFSLHRHSPGQQGRFTEGPTGLIQPESGWVNWENVPNWMCDFWVTVLKPSGRVWALHWPTSKLFPSACLSACKHTSLSARLSLTVLLDLFTFVKYTYLSPSASNFYHCNGEQRSTQNCQKFDIWHQWSIRVQFSF